MAYLVVGNITYSNTGNRNSALSAINSALSAFTYESVETIYTAGVNNSGNTVTISVRISDADVEAVRAALLAAWTVATRATTGHYISTFKVPD